MFNQDGSTPIRNTGRDGSYRTQGEQGMRPASDPKSQKDFKKILGRDSNDEDAAGDNSDNLGDTGVAVKPKSELAPQTVSLFGLSGSKSKDVPQNTGFIGKEETAFIGKAETAPAEPHTSLFSLMATKEAKPSVGEVPGKQVVGSLLDTPQAADPSHVVKNQPLSHPSLSKEGEDNMSEGNMAQASLPSPPTENSKKEKFTTRFATEQTDLSYVNLMAVQPQPVAPVEGQITKAVMPVTDIHEIVNQLIDKLYTISQSGKTDTAVILKHPPLLAGAHLIVTSFDNAKGEFNISFENLTQAAKNVLDMRLNQESLMNALEQKGYAVHILTTTTLVENRPIPTDNAQSQQQGRDDRDQPRDGRQRRPHEDERDA